MTRSATVLILGLILLGAPPAFAGAIGFESLENVGTSGTYSLGFEFRVNSTITVTELGFFDSDKDDLAGSHEVGIFDTSGSLLVSGTVDPGDTLDGWFRYTAVAGTVLYADSTYYIMAVTGSDPYASNAVGFTVDPSITFVQAVQNPDQSEGKRGTLLYPSETSDDVENGWFGPNFSISGAVVPLPSAVGLALPLLAGWLLLRRARGRKISF